MVRKTQRDKMNILYPIFLKLEGKTCKVIGGGEIGTQKVKSLLDAKADVTVISPSVTQELRDLAEQCLIKIISRKYEPTDLDNCFLLFVATDDKELNHRIFTDANDKNIICNVVDDPPNCDFYVPAIYTKGDLKIAVSTNGKSPYMARKIKEDLAQFYGEGFEVFLALLGDIREELKLKIDTEEERKALVLKICNNCTPDMLRLKSRDEIKQEIKKWI